MLLELQSSVTLDEMHNFRCFSIVKSILLSQLSIFRVTPMTYSLFLLIDICGRF
jgi:hypothetical protein